MNERSEWNEFLWSWSQKLYHDQKQFSLKIVFVVTVFEENCFCEANIVENRAKRVFEIKSQKLYFHHDQKQFSKKIVFANKSKYIFVAESNWTEWIFMKIVDFHKKCGNSFRRNCFCEANWVRYVYAVNQSNRAKRVFVISITKILLPIIFFILWW